MKTKITGKNLYKIFGGSAEEALKLLQAGKDKDEIFEATGQTVGVNDASFEVAEGEIFVVMGLSGSGKSTLVRMINGLIKPSAGEILIDGVDVGSCSDEQLRRVRREKVAMVFQHFALFPHKTVADNVAFGLKIKGMPAAERREKAQVALDQVGLGARADSYPDELSGGMQQRVGLARAFATDAPILLMDEPFSALDPLIRTKLQDELLDLQDKLKKTILFVSHDLEEALKIGNTISIMEGGRIVQTGAPEEIVLAPANDYVRDFIANVNPLSVLTAWNIMRDARDLDAAGDNWLWLDRRHTTRFKFDENMLVIDAERNGTPAIWVSCENMEDLPADKPQVFWASPGTPLKTVMAAMHRSATAPVALFDDQSRFVGSIGVRDVLKAVIRR